MWEDTSRLLHSVRNGNTRKSTHMTSGGRYWEWQARELAYNDRNGHNLVTKREI